MHQLAASASRRSEFPDWVLVGRLAHIGRRRRDDAATAWAWAWTSDGHPIEVALVPADPPALTRCFVHCPDLTADDFVESPPFVDAADGAFLLISVLFPRRTSDVSDYFVFRSGPGTPSLELLPRPYPVPCLSIHVGVLSCGDHCLVVDPEWRFSRDDGRLSYHLHVFSSKTKSWCTKVARLPCDIRGYRDWFQPGKVFAIGGGSMAWVALREGILLCDSVAEAQHPEVRLIQLPPLMPMNYDRPRSGSDSDDDRLLCLDPIRDVTFSNGWFRFIEVGFLRRLFDGPEQLDSHWTATMFKMKISSEDCQWEPCGTADSVDISPADNLCVPDLLPEIWNLEDKNKLALGNVVSLHPTLDMYNDDMVYMVAKIESLDPSGWVLAVNTANKKLEKISPFLEESFHFWRIYLQSDFPKHISKAPEAQWTHDQDKCTNRKKIELLEANLLAALDQLRKLETHVESLNRRYDGSMPVFFTGAASYLNQNIQKTMNTELPCINLGTQDAKYGLNIDRGTNAVCDCSRLMGDLRLQLLTSIDEMKSKITLAHGALYE